ncbi:argininosuccinate lyase [Tichowtungia aerotolerans]|uniref:Argininosuccinate lyase n=1 Tax=Tichowtungia aerotolerans TaxID=2697043 RepID=A0A6P1M2X0_9BACT|nr:argininosuccinate lyase [Tichowtungia aerotolerans]QHI68442.1 argininosuccinate lyase [Tichowtungia aerotolerans]
MKTQKTTVGTIDEEVLAFTAGRDVELDVNLIQADCIGTAAHVTMLSRMKPAIITADERKQVIGELKKIIELADEGKFKIRLADQDVHLAVERTLTEKLGDLGKKIHTCRSRNDQVAVDLRLFAREELLGAIEEAVALAAALLKFGRKHQKVPMVGRTHMQPGMPSSVGLWASAHAESLLDDCVLLVNAYELNDQCPLGSAASYGVPLEINRELTSDLLGFRCPVHNVLYANNSRGKNESIILSAMSQVMLTLSRMAQDLMLFTMPEFGYFTLPDELTTGSSIMPQKKNPDVIELVRARASKVKACELAVYDLIKGSPTGYNRDLQDAKEFFMDGVATTRACLRVLSPFIEAVEVNKQALIDGFRPDVFATDRALELVGEGMPFRDAYHYVKENIGELESIDPRKAIEQKTHLGAPMGIDWALFKERVAAVNAIVREQRKMIDRTVNKLFAEK